VINIIFCLTTQEVSNDLSQSVLNKVQPPKDVYQPGKFTVYLLCFIWRLF